MIKRAEEALIEIESMMNIKDVNDEPNKLKLFTRDKYLTSLMPKFPKNLTADAHFSYSTSVNLVFLLFIILGLLGGLLIIIIILCTNN